jgi:flagellar biosynthesis protein FlhG
VTDKFLDAKLKYLGHVPRDEDLPRAVRVQQPVVELYPRAPASRALTALCDAFLASEPPSLPSGGVKLFWQQILKGQTAAHATG